MKDCNYKWRRILDQLKSPSRATFRRVYLRSLPRADEAQHSNDVLPGGQILARH